MVDKIGNTFEVETVNGMKEFPLAVGYQIKWNTGDPSFLVPVIDDDFEDGSQEVRAFNMEYVVDYGWV